MHYVCIENGQVIGVQNYQPSVPPSVTVVTISDEQHKQIINQTHRFDVSTKSVISLSSAEMSAKQQEITNGTEREFLNRTDWKVLRHIRQKALGVPTSLTDAEYIKLEQDRNAAAARIV